MEKVIEGYNEFGMRYRYKQIARCTRCDEEPEEIHPIGHTSNAIIGHCIKCGGDVIWRSFLMFSEPVTQRIP